MVGHADDGGKWLAPKCPCLIKKEGFPLSKKDLPKKF